MSFYLTYQIKGVDGKYVMPLTTEDDVKYALSRVKKDFAIIQDLKAKIFGSYLQSTNIVSKCISSQDVITFETDYRQSSPMLTLYRQPIITPRYKSQNTFIVFSTVNFNSMICGDKITVNESDTQKEIQNKIQNMLIQKYKAEIDAKEINVVLFLPGGIPFTPNVPIGKFIESFPDSMPHLYAIVVHDKKILSLLDKTYDTVCNIKSEDLRFLLSPCFASEVDGLCEIASVLGFIHQNGPNVKRMIYSIAKFCPFAPMICGLFKLSCKMNPTGRDILQITAPLSALFVEMSSYLSDKSNLFKHAAKFLTFFMNVAITDRVPCTQFAAPFFNIGLERYFYENWGDGGNQKDDIIFAFDPDIKDEDWITFKLPKFNEDVFREAMEQSKELKIYIPLNFRGFHRVALFSGNNGPCLFLSSENEPGKMDYIDPEVGVIQTDTYENVALKYKNFVRRENAGTSVIVPEILTCPLTRKIMKEPVKASSGAFYEKRALERYVSVTKNPTCRVLKDENGKPIQLPLSRNMDLPVDLRMQSEINKWMHDCHFHDEEEYEDPEEKNIALFLKSGQKIQRPLYIIKYDESSQVQDNLAHNYESNSDDDEFDEFNSYEHHSRPRPELC